MSLLLLFNQPSGGNPTVSLSATEGADTASFSVATRPLITVGATEGADTASFNVGLRQRITTSATEGADTAAFSVGVSGGTVTVTMGATEAPDVASFLLNNPDAIVPRKKGAAGPESDFRRRRAQVVVNGKTRELATAEDARKVIQAQVEKAKHKAKVLAKKDPESIPNPPVIEINYDGEIASLNRMVQEANNRILDMYAQAFARAMERAQEDEDEIAILLLH
jgi:hypothetical protein